MSTTNPALVAAAPILINAFKQLQIFVNTALTGDPIQFPARADAAFDILLGNLKLQLPTLFVAEVSVVQTDINARIGSVITNLQGLSAAPAATATVAKPA